MKRFIQINWRCWWLPLFAALLVMAGCRRDDDRDLLPPPGYAMPGFISLAGDSDAEFTSGWYAAEAGTNGPGWRWMGKRGEIQLRNQSSEMKLRLRGWVPLELLSAAPTLRVSINGHELESFTPPKGHFTKTYTVPHTMQGESEKSILVIETSITAKSPNDTRELGYSLIQLVWEPLAKKP